MLAIICVTVVLPLLPVTAISGSIRPARQALGQGLQGRQRVRHAQPRQAGFGDAALGQRGHGAACRAPATRKSCASKRSPLSATKRSPGRTVRVSLCTRRMIVAASPISVDPGTSWCATPSVIIAAASRSAAWTSSASEKGCFVPAMSW